MYLDRAGSYAQIPVGASKPTPACRYADMALVRAAVRGECRPADLQTAGIRLGRYGVKTAAHVISTLSLGAADLASGILTLRNDPLILSDWASFIVMASDCFRFDDASADYAEHLIAAAWDIAFSGTPDMPTLRLAENICRQVRAA